MKKTTQSIEDARKTAANFGAVSVSDRKLAAAMGALGFPSQSRLIVPETTRRPHIEFTFGPPSVRKEYAKLSPLIGGSWQNKEWRDSNPFHPICEAMRANHNYDRIEDWLHGTCSAIVLRSLSSGVMEYRQSKTPHAVQISPTIDVSDKLMVAALAQVGFPIIKIRGTRSAPVFTLPMFGYSRMQSDGTYAQRKSVAELTQMVEVDGELHLAIEFTDPNHPLILAYETLLSRMHLKELIEHRTQPLVQLVDGQYQAIVTPGATGRVMDAIRRRFGSPPISAKTT